MSRSRFRISIRQTMLLFLAVAVGCVMVKRYGRQVIWKAQTSLDAPVVALTRVSSNGEENIEPMSQITFCGLRITVPKELVSKATVVESPKGSKWLAFNGSTRMIQIPLNRSDTAFEEIGPPTKESDGLPSQIERILQADSRDASMTATSNELRHHQWAMRARKSLGVDVNAFRHYRRISSPAYEAILISVPNEVVQSVRSPRAVLVWDKRDSDSTGCIWFGDNGASPGGWIDRVADGLAWETSGDIPQNKLSLLSTSECLELLEVLGDARD